MSGQTRHSGDPRIHGRRLPESAVHRHIPSGIRSIRAIGGIGRHKCPYESYALPRPGDNEMLHGSTVGQGGSLCNEATPVTLCAHSAARAASWTPLASGHSDGRRKLLQWQQTKGRRYQAPRSPLGP
jgi:hypothetical protein